MAISLYPSKVRSTQKPGPLPKQLERLAANGQRMYGSPYGVALDGYYHRRAADFNAKGDSEGVRLSRAERTKMDALARKASVTPEALKTVLGVQREYDLHPRSAEAKEARRGQTREALRLKLGDSAAREQMLNDYVAATSVIARELPEFATRMTETGADLDIRNVEALAPLGARLRQSQK